MDRGDRITDKVLHTVLYHRRTEMESKKKKKGLASMKGYSHPFHRNFITRSGQRPKTCFRPMFCSRLSVLASVPPQVSLNFRAIYESKESVLNQCSQ